MLGHVQLRLRELIIRISKTAKNKIIIKMSSVFLRLFVGTISLLVLFLFCKFGGCNWLDNRLSINDVVLMASKIAVDVLG